MFTAARFSSSIVRHCSLISEADAFIMAALLETGVNERQVLVICSAFRWASSDLALSKRCCKVKLLLSSSLLQIDGDIIPAMKVSLIAPSQC